MEELTIIMNLGLVHSIYGAIEMAKEFPHAKVVGVDLAPIPFEPEQMPPNCQMEIDDINLGLPHFHTRWDIVHMRCVYGGLKDYRKTLEEVQRCLKPGGILLVIGPELRYVDTERKAYLPIGSDENPDGSWFQRISYEVKHAAALNGGDKVGTDAILDEGFWDYDTVMDPETCGTGSVYFPVGPWASSPDADRNSQLQFSGALMRQNMLHIHRSWHSLLKKFGLQDEMLEQWATHIDEELHTMKFKSWIRFRMAWRRRRDAPGEPATRLSVPDVYIAPHLQSSSNASPDRQPTAISGTSENSNTKELYHVEVYRTKAESLEATRRRAADGEQRVPLSKA